MDIIKPESGWGMIKLIFYLTVFFFISLNQTLAQNPPISPKWVFEPVVWEDQTNTETSDSLLIAQYKSNGIPVGANIIDSPWERQYTGNNYNDSTNNGYNTFIFNPTRYNNPLNFIHNLHTQDIHVILWITGLIDKKCGLYNQIPPNYFVNGGATYSWWNGSKNASLIDFFNTTAVNYWKGLMDQDDINEVDGWKVDESYHLLAG